MHEPEAVGTASISLGEDHINIRAYGKNQVKIPHDSQSYSFYREGVIELSDEELDEMYLELTGQQPKEGSTFNSINPDENRVVFFVRIADDSWVTAPVVFVPLT